MADDLKRLLQEDLSRARDQAAKAVGWPVVLRLEGLGLRIVPEWGVEMLEMVAAKSLQAPGAASGTGGKQKP